MANVELLQKTLATVEEVADSGAWSQGDWRTDDDRCGSVMCFAGWAAQLAGGKWAADASNPFSDLLHAEPGDARIHAIDSYEYDNLGFETVFVSDRAERVLGISSKQGNVMFRGGNTLDDLRACVTALIADPEAELDDFVTEK